MNRLLTLMFGRLPIGWLQLTHSRGRFFAAVAGVAFANLLVFMQLGIMGALNSSTVAPYAMLNADIILPPSYKAAPIIRNYTKLSIIYLR